MATLRERVIGVLGGVTRGQADLRTRRAFENGVEMSMEDEPVSGTLKRQGYSTLTGNAVRDLGGLDYATVLNAAWKIYLSNPVARRYLQVKRDYILGRGITVQAGDDDLQTILDAFWQANKLDERLKKFTLQLHLLGEQIYPVFVRQSDGRVKLGYIDPAQIERVITHPENVLEQWAVVLKEQHDSDAWGKTLGKRVYRIVREQEEAFGEDEQPRESEHLGQLVTHEQAALEDWETRLLSNFGLTEYSGSVLYFSINNLSNQPRGHSDLLQVADWLDQLDATLFALADREQMADFFSWDVAIDGDDTVVRRRAGEVSANPPRKGSANFHNKQEEWRLDRPDLKQSGTVESSNTILTFALGGLGLPRHWYGYGDETNRATAGEQNTPTWRTMENDQDTTRDMLLTMLTFARDQAEIAGTWNGDEEAGEITLTMPEMTSRDVTAISQAMSQVATALGLVEGMGLVTRERLAEVWAKLLAELGVEYDWRAELEQVDEEAEEAELDDAQKRNDMLLQQMTPVDTGAGNGTLREPPPGVTPPQLAPFAQAMQGMSDADA